MLSAIFCMLITPVWEIRQAVSNFMNMFTGDISAYPRAYRILLYNVIGQVFAGSFWGAALFFLSWKMGLILFVSIPILADTKLTACHPIFRKSMRQIRGNEDGIMSFYPGTVQKNTASIKAYRYYKKPSRPNSAQCREKNKTREKYTKLGLWEGLVYFANNCNESVIFLYLSGVDSYFGYQRGIILGRGNAYNGPALELYYHTAEHGFRRR